MFEITLNFCTTTNESEYKLIGFFFALEEQFIAE